MVAALIFQYFLNGALIALPVITVVVLIVLSFTFPNWPRVSAVIALLPGVLIPVFVLLGYLSGSAPVWLLAFDWAIFGWVVLSALKFLLISKKDS